ncbi:hypothetical protein GCM10022247_11820 [Allokutzneria multivorans]|uniref:Uncharacterized protein n=1 Tax=Allokutzneria multivorans TaxID=1142134 RepID=A0ABP7R805_9PSEU
MDNYPFLVHGPGSSLAITRMVRLVCRRITCSKCGKPTYRGCGSHVEQVLGDVPRAERCSCAAEVPQRGRWRLFGRR